VIKGGFMEYAKDWKTENRACTLEDMSNNILVLEKLVPVFIQFFVHAFSSRVLGFVII